MTKEQQDHLWAFLLKGAREEMHRFYKSPCSNPEYKRGFNNALEVVFGPHNLTSYTEPEEMLMVKRKDVIDFYNKYIGNPTREISRLGLRKEIKSLFGDKCLPDKELEHRLEQTSVQVEPKFKVGDKVYQTVGHNRLDEYTIKKVYTDKERGIVYDIQGLIGIMGVEENKLCLSCQNPYTEPSNVSADETMNETKDNMEEKELNLCELLNLGDIIYNPTFGYGRVDLVNTDIKPYFCVSFEDAVVSLSFLHNGIEANSNSRPSIWPNEELYEKYPLDAYSAWMEWKESRKPKSGERNKEKVIGI